MYEVCITRNTLISDIQDVFNQLYPSLWIDFFSIPYQGEGLYSHSFPIGPEVILYEYCHGVEDVSIDISENKTVSEVKNSFRNRLGLDVHILRKYGTVKVETTLTQDWTLGRQNDEGEQIQF